MAFILVHFTVGRQFQAGSVALAMMCEAFSILACLIMPRLYTAFVNRNSKMINMQLSRTDIVEKSQTKSPNVEGMKVNRELSVI